MTDIPKQKEETDQTHSIKEQTTIESTEVDHQVETLKDEELEEKDQEHTGQGQNPTDQAPTINHKEDPTDLVLNINLNLGTPTQTIED